VVQAQQRPGELVVEWSGEEPSWLRPALSILAELWVLPENWNSYGARTVSKLAIDTSLAILREVMLDNRPRAQFVPTVRGGVQMEWHTGGIDLEIEVEPSGAASVFFGDRRTGEEWEDDYPACQARVKDVLSNLPRAG